MKSKKTEKLIEYGKSKLFEAVMPTYLLDEAYHFLVWNETFDEVVARHLNLRLGMHAVEFITHCENRKECLERSAEVFAVGKNPVVDHEPLIYKTKRYGKIHFHKFATSFHHTELDLIVWIVTLNICGADKLDLLLSDIMATIDRVNHS